MFSKTDTVTTMTTETTGFDLEAGSARISSLRPFIYLLDIGYILLVLFAQEKLSNLIKDKAFLRNVSLIWNSMNALFSLFVVALLLPEFLYALFIQGWDYALCSTGDLLTGRLSGFAMYIFTLSKIWELFDTVLLMLRGRPIFFLHYYHHALVLYSVFSAYPNNGSFARLETMMSAIVRCILYTYFALVAISSSYRKYSKYVTFAHLLQFIIICYGIVYARKRIELGEPCETDTNQLSFHSLLMIFAQFIYAYLTRSRVSRGGLRLRKIK